MLPVQLREGLMMKAEVDSQIGHWRIHLLAVKKGR